MRGLEGSMASNADWRFCERSEQKETKRGVSAQRRIPA